MSRLQICRVNHLIVEDRQYRYLLSAFLIWTKFKATGEVGYKPFGVPEAGERQRRVTPTNGIRYAKDHLSPRWNGRRSRYHRHVVESRCRWAAGREGIGGWHSRGNPGFGSNAEHFAVRAHGQARQDPSG
jgi:hypothetical protein